MRFHVFVRYLPLLSLLLIATSARSQTILYDSNGFESPTFTAGSSPAGQDSSNPWQTVGGSPTAFVIENSTVASGSQALEGIGGGLNDGSFAFPGIFAAPTANQKVDIQVDMARTLSPNVADSSPVYAVEEYDDAINRVSRFGLQETNGQIRAFISVPINGQGQVDPNGTSVMSEFFGPAIAPGQFVHFDFTMDYSTKTVDLSMNGTPIAQHVPFVTQSSTDIVAAALQVGTLPNSSDNGFFDNYKVSLVPYLQGDANGDGVVNSQDIAIATSDWLKTGIGVPGDVNEDGIVNSQDIAIMTSNWLQTMNTTTTAPTLVPEPGTLVLAAGGLLCLVVCRLRKPRQDRR